MLRVVLDNLATGDGIFHLVTVDDPSNPLLGTVNGVPIAAAGDRLGDLGHLVGEIIVQL